MKEEVKRAINILNDALNSSDAPEVSIDPIDNVRRLVDNVRRSRRKLYGDKFTSDSNEFLISTIKNKISRIEENLNYHSDAYSYESVIDNSIDAVNYLYFLLHNNYSKNVDNVIDSTQLLNYIKTRGEESIRNSVKTLEVQLSLHECNFNVANYKVDAVYLSYKNYPELTIDKNSRRNFIQFNSNYDADIPECLSSINFIWKDYWLVSCHFRSSDIEKLDTDITYIKRLCQLNSIENYKLNLLFDNLHIYL